MNYNTLIFNVNIYFTGSFSSETSISAFSPLRYSLALVNFFFVTVHISAGLASILICSAPPYLEEILHLGHTMVVVPLHLLPQCPSAFHAVGPGEMMKP